MIILQGVVALVEAVQLIKDGKAPRIVQSTDGATYDELWTVLSHDDLLSDDPLP